MYMLGALTLEQRVNIGQFVTRMVIMGVKFGSMKIIVLEVCTKRFFFAMTMLRFWFLSLGFLWASLGLSQRHFWAFLTHLSLSKHIFIDFEKFSEPQNLPRIFRAGPLCVTIYD